MKNINIIFLSLLTAPALQALDFQTDALCKKLKTAIEQAQSVEKIQASWSGVTAGLSQVEKITLAQQAATYAQEQKLALEQTLTALGDKNYDASKLKWGAVQTTFAIWCVASAISYLDIKKISSPYVALCLFPLSFPLGKDNTISENTWLALLYGGFFIDLTSPIFLYKGIKNLYQSLNHKQILETKINNLTATIEFLQSLTMLP